ncbi:chloride channel protein [Telmatospirillum sp.]|uniref:chloride channel protein n=1 Tax=Telmatospirillum sp. TaxID=2079197 RepID=UPI002844F6C0|nr:chloride channel protein [Telmatospirillum sp.]MDR3438385.1 chloride channel protein [Telmatospirillum sp.]
MSFQSPQTRFFRSARYRGFLTRQQLRRVVFWAGATFVAAAAILFAKGSTVAYETFHAAAAQRPWLVLVLCPLGLALSLWLTRQVFVGAQGSGIPQTIAAIGDPVFAASGVLSLRVAFGKIVLTMLGLACGASVGREGPSVQVGAAIMHSLGRRLNLSEVRLQRALVVAGGAAGVAAAFNTPLAGVVFAIEELSRSFDMRTSGRVFSAVIMAGIASLAVLGNYTFFGHTDAVLTVGNGWLPVIVCGVAGGLAGGLFASILVRFSRRGLPGRAGAWVKSHPIAFAASCGVVLAGLGLLSGGDTYGTGYRETRALLSGQSISPAWGLLKMAATIVSYASGIPGGIFSPSLATGAGLGRALADWMPMAPSGAVIILGMVAYFSGAVQAPITAVVIVMEMTDNQALTIPLMASALIAFSVSRQICGKPLYKALAEGFRPPAAGTRPPL